MRASLFACFLIGVRALCLAVESPVTRGELDAVLRKAEAALVGVLQLQTGLPKPIVSANQTPESTKAATRAQTLAGLNRLFELAKPKFRFTPKPIFADTSRLTLPTDPNAKEVLLKLIRWGCVAPTGPLAAGKKDALMPEELGDALGWFLCRIAELTHSPDIEYSPYLTPDGSHPTPGKNRNRSGG